MITYETRVVSHDDTYTFECACNFTSTGWPSRDLAAARGAGHSREHETGEPMLELAAFRAKHGLNGPNVTKIAFKSKD